jgi:hypothetical protein
VENESKRAGASLHRRGAHASSLEGGSNMGLRVWLPLAFAGIGTVAACTSPPEQQPSRSVARAYGNATVRSVVYMEEPNAAPTAERMPATASAPSAAPAKAKPDARAAKRPKTSAKRRARPAPPATKPVAAAVPVQPPPKPAAPAYRYTYSVELDSGEFRTFGFADDQQHRVGDRVAVSDSGVAAVPK